jgi:membrane-associated phospholipid phosphatase
LTPPLAVAAWGWAVVVLVIVAAATAVRYGRRGQTAAPGARRRFWATLLLMVVVPAAAFATVAGLVLAQGTPSWDTAILRLVARHQQVTARSFVEAFTTLGSLWLVLVLLAAALAVLLLARRYRQAAFVATATLLSMTAAGVMKLVFARPRPEVIPQPLGRWSFPSGHTMTATGLAISLLVVIWPTRWRIPALALATVCAIGVGLTRVYLGYHYPSDVVAGWALSLAVVGVTLLAFGGQLGAAGGQDRDAGTGTAPEAGGPSTPESD